MKYWIYICFILIAAGCEKKGLDIPQLEPDLEAHIEFQDGSIFAEFAGLNDYVLDTDGFIAGRKTVFHSTLKPIDCNSNCGPSLSVELHRSQEKPLFTDTEEARYFTTLDQVIEHKIEVKTESNLSYILFTENETLTIENNWDKVLQFGQGEAVNIALSVLNVDGESIINFSQSLFPIEQQGFEIEIEIEKTDSLTRFQVLGDEVMSVVWGDQYVGNERIFYNKDALGFFDVVFTNGTIQNVQFHIPKESSNIDKETVGYKYTNTLLPDQTQADIHDVEIVYKDEFGDIYRSSKLQQILPHSFQISNVKEYIENEEKINTYECDIQLSCILKHTESNKTKYIKNGKLRFAFVEEVK